MKGLVYHGPGRKAWEDSNGRCSGPWQRSSTTMRRARWSSCLRARPNTEEVPDRLARSVTFDPGPGRRAKRTIEP